MKILICSFTYFPEINGVQNVTQYQAEGLAALGHEVTVITGYPRNQASSQSNEIHNNVKIERIHAKTDVMIHFGDKKEYQRRVIDYSSKMDVIMTVCPESWATDWIIEISDRISCGLVMMAHGIHNYSWKNFHDRSVYGLTRKIWGDIRWKVFFINKWDSISRYDIIMHLHENDFAYQYFNAHGIKNNEVLYNAIDERFFNIDGIKKQNRIVNVGTFCKQKNQQLCLTSFYRTEIHDYELVLIGPQMNKYTKQLINLKKILDKEYGYRQVSILHGLTRERTIQLIQESKIYLLTSISEMFPISLLEGMATGAAFVSTDVGINRYLPGGVIASSAEMIASEIEKLIYDDRWLELGRLGRAFTEENCRREKQIKTLEAFLKEGAQKHNGE